MNLRKLAVIKFQIIHVADCKTIPAMQISNMNFDFRDVQFI